MSLHECVLGVADMMERTVAEWEQQGLDREVIIYTKMYAGHLRILVKSHEAPAPVLTWPGQAVAPAMPAELQHAMMIEKARAEFRKDKKVEEKEQKIVLLMDGSLNGDYVPIDPSMPVGAKTQIAGEVYVLKEDGKLHFVPEASLALPIPVVTE